MVFNSLLAAFITYSLNIVYNLLNGRNLKTVFYSGIRYFVLAFIITALVQLFIYLYRDYAEHDSLEKSSKKENEAEELQQTETEAENES
jgi:hypothetical protein